MIEIAISLAIIAFALIAIIGVLPIGLRVQRDNREETIINQDAIYLMDAIRSGAQGLNDLTNYVDRITVNGVGASNFYNGAQIIGLLSTPNSDFFHTTKVVAYMRAISGNASEKPPQTDLNIQSLAFAYRVNAEIIPHIAPTNGPGQQINNNLTNSLFELRLTFRWPLYPNNTVGNGKLTFRTLASGNIQTNVSTINGNIWSVYFVQPSTFIPAP